MDTSARCLLWFVEAVVPERVGLNDRRPFLNPFAPDNMRWQPEEMVMFEVVIEMTPEFNRMQWSSEQSSYSISLFGADSRKEHPRVWGICFGDLFSGDGS